MNILVTGANGFLGDFVVNELKKYHSIKSLSRTKGDYKVSLEKEIPFFDQKFDLIIHAAGKAHSIPKTNNEQKQFYDVNVLGTINLLKGLEKSNLPNEFIFISSVSVYGQEIGNNISENHSLDAKDPYGLSKIEAEEIILNWCKKNDIVCSILRLPLLVGKNPPGNLGDMIKAIRKGYYFNIGGGRAQKSMVLAQDVAVLIPTVAPIGGIFNLTDGVHPNFYELSKVISKHTYKPLSIPIIIAKGMGLIGDLIGDKAPINSQKIMKIISDLTFDDTNAREKLGWKPQEVLTYLKNNTL